MFYWISKTFVLFVVACLAASFSSAASAAVTILYISTTGSNSNPCTLAQPCRTLQKAVNKAPEGGEVHVLDSGSYGNNANIRKSITISGNGHTITLGKPITVNDAGATVTLRRLVLNGGSSATRSIEILAARTVHIEHCVVHSFTAQGIYVSAEDSVVFVSDSVVRDNQSGLEAYGSGSKLTVDKSRFERNQGNGVYTSFDVESTVTRTISSYNTVGFQTVGGRMRVIASTSAYNNSQGYIANNGAELVLESSVAHGSIVGLLAINSGTITISNSVVTHNTTGFSVPAGSTVLTRQNNTVTGNTTDVSGEALTPLDGM